ncbi:cysteine hydrolase family protein [Variovorax sp. VNK109]|uniref:cysteine hydrolase family protein n=1 Tax=Variovorax sp. VNK109 TaxID=3400919 RepID=UPI003C0DAAF2
MNSAPINPRRTALIVVDLQNDFLADDGAYARGGARPEAALALPDRVAEVARSLREAAGMVTGSQFTLWPDTAGEPMIAPHLHSLRPFLRRGDFAPGSRGQQFVARIAPLIDVTVCKVAYSAFFNTQLDWVLRHAGIDTVAVCGIVTSGGVASTARDAHMREYRTLVLGDGCAVSSQAAHDAALADLKSVCEVMDCGEFTALIRARA